MKVRTGTEHVNNNYTKIAQQNTGKKRGKDNIGLQVPGSKSWTHECKGQWRTMEDVCVCVCVCVCVSFKLWMIICLCFTFTHVGENYYIDRFTPENRCTTKERVIHNTLWIRVDKRLSCQSICTSQGSSSY